MSRQKVTAVRDVRPASREHPAQTARHWCAVSRAKGQGERHHQHAAGELPSCGTVHFSLTRSALCHVPAMK